MTLTVITELRGDRALSEVYTSLPAFEIKHTYSAGSFKLTILTFINYTTQHPAGLDHLTSSMSQFDR